MLQFSRRNDARINGCTTLSSNRDHAIIEPGRNDKLRPRIESSLGLARTQNRSCSGDHFGDFVCNSLEAFKRAICAEHDFDYRKATDCERP